MKYSFFRLLTVCVLSSVLSVCVSAQNLGDIGSGNIGGGNIGGGNTGGGNISGGSTGSSGNNSSGGYSNSGSNTGSSSNSSSANSEFGTTIEAPTLQDFQESTSQTFIGRDSSIPFIGREEQPFSDRQTSSTTRRTTTSTSSSTRRATSSRMTSNRSMSSSRSGLNSSGNGRTVRAATQAEFALSPMEVSQRTTEFQTRITRLPNLHLVPEQIEVNLESTPQGNIATLTGTVASERERKVLKQLLLLEPGIDKVENKLITNGN
jgi:hypothetical protein